MSTPTIPAGNLFMNATLYTGNGGTQTITNGVAGQSFQPDFVWAKSRGTTNYNLLEDSVRGAGYALYSNVTNAEAGPSYFISSFNSNGFSVTSSPNGTVNTNADPMVAWQWKAGGTAVSNTAGSITSQVSANPTSGFSIVTYTGTGANATVGHGLGIAPNMVIVKARTVGANPNPYWSVYHSALGATQIIFLDRTDATSTNSAPWNNTAPTSSVFTIGNGNSTNYNGNTFVAYCWTPIAGYSQFGSYTGNGSADGPFVYTGFRPKFILAKSTTSGSENWYILDSSRNIYNVADALLNPNLSNAEQTYSQLDFLSNGFKIRNTGTGMNASGATMIYAAFAENPFKYANAR
jgi:hypothetical protein